MRLRCGRISPIALRRRALKNPRDRLFRDVIRCRASYLAFFNLSIKASIPAWAIALISILLTIATVLIFKFFSREKANPAP